MMNLKKKFQRVKIKMWIILKHKTNSLNFLKHEISKKLNLKIDFYSPKIKFDRIVNGKLLGFRELKLLGDYVLCYHPNFSNKKTLDQIKNIKGLKYILNGYSTCQKEIKDFVYKCKINENEDGFLKQTFFGFELEKTMKFLNGPFSNMIFKIIEVQKRKIQIILDGKKTTIKKNSYLFSSI